MQRSPVRVCMKERKALLFKARLIVCGYCPFNKHENGKHHGRHGRNNRYKNHRKH